MKVKLFFLFALLLTIGIEMFAQQIPQRKTPQGSSNSARKAKPDNLVPVFKDNLLKLPSVITKSGAYDTLTIRFQYGNMGEIKHIESKNEVGLTETFSFRHLKSKIIYTYVTVDDSTIIDTLYTNDGLLTKDHYYSYIYENRKLVEIKPTSCLGNHYTIFYDDAGNAIEQVRVLPPLWKGDEEVTQTAVYKYDEALKTKFFFSTDWYFCPLSSNVDDVYRLPSGSLFGIGSENLVKEVMNNSKSSTYLYDYKSFDESGYPTHYVINEDPDYETGSSVLADYKISYVIPVDIRNGKWGCIDKNMKQLVAYKFDTATYKDFSFDGKTISCTKSDISICMDTVGNMLNLKTNAGKSYNTICDAITAGDIEAINKFIDFSVNLNIQYKYRNKTYWNDDIIDGYPIELLVSSSNEEIKKNIVELLGLFFDHGLDINIKATFYPMSTEVIRSGFSKDDKIKMLQILLDNHANINEIGQNRNTPLMELCDIQAVYGTIGCSNAYDIAKFMIEHGADPAIKNIEGNTAIKISKKTNCTELIDLLSTKKK